MLINNIEVQVNKKDIKHYHLSVMPPNGNVIISCPKNSDDKVLKVFLSDKINWIKKQKEVFKSQKRQSKRQFVTGETFYIWGVPYKLRFVVNEKNNKIYAKNDILYLEMKKDSTTKNRFEVVKKFYSEILTKKLDKYVKKWEKVLGYESYGYAIRYMKTRWGSCKYGKLIFNTQLAEKNIKALDYVVLHELLHLKHKRHNKKFVKDMDTYLPNWRLIRDGLNEEILDYI